MATITQQRMQQLKQLYDELKIRVYAVDDKYSMTFIQPVLDMPDSLNLKKLVFTPRSEQELQTLAGQQADAVILSKLRSADASYNSKLKALAIERAELQNKTSAELEQKESDFNSRCEALKQKLIDNGLYFSSVYTNAMDKERARYESELSAVLQQQLDDADILSKQQTDAEQLHDSAVASLERERDARLQQAYAKLVQDEQDERQRIDKYNNSLDEKEQKYLASRARAYEYAKRVESSRVINIAEIYAKLGETGFRERILQEKLALCRDAFAPLRRDEAQAVLTFDSFLQNQLGSYYSTFVDWVNLLPA